MRTLLGIGLLVMMGAATAADDKIDAKKLVGKWEINDTKAEVKGTVDFTKDGKLKYVVDVKGMEIKMDGTYKIDGNKIEIKVKFMDNEMTKNVTVKKLTDSELTVENETGEEKTLKRVK